MKIIDASCTLDPGGVGRLLEIEKIRLLRLSAEEREMVFSKNISTLVNSET
jgi:hypothetical protein